MKLRAFILLSILFSALLVQGAVDPYSDFALHVAKIAERQNVNASTWSGGFTSNEPPGGQVFRGFYDFDGDGLEDLILLSSVNVPYASIYRNLGTNSYSRITDKAVLHNLHFAIAKEGNVTFVTSIAYERYFASVAENSLSPNGSLDVSISNFDGKEAGEIELARYGIPEEARRTQKITMMELLLTRNPHWTDANPSLRLYGQDCDLPKELIDAQHNFTPESVIARIKQLEDMQPNVVGNEKSGRPTATPIQPIKSAASPTPVPEPKPTSSSFPVVPVAILAAATVAVVLFLMRRKSP